jgi:hypothetical protein
MLRAYIYFTVVRPNLTERLVSCFLFFVSCLLSLPTNVNFSTVTLWIVMCMYLTFKKLYGERHSGCPFSIAHCTTALFYMPCTCCMYTTTITDIKA